MKKNKTLLVVLSLLATVVLVVCSIMIFRSFTYHENFILDKSSNEDVPTQTALTATVRNGKVIKEVSETENLHIKIESDENLKSYQEGLKGTLFYGIRGYKISVQKSKAGYLTFHTEVDYQDLDYTAYKDAIKQNGGVIYDEMPDVDTFTKKLEELGFKKLNFGL